MGDACSAMLRLSLDDPIYVSGGPSSYNWGFGMMAGTSPSIASLPNGSFEIAFQANTGYLWTVGEDNHDSWNLGMKAGTSPSIAGFSGGGYTVAFQANTGLLYTAYTSNRGTDPGDYDWGLGMRAGTSPSLTSLPSGSNLGYEIEFQANTGHLWTVGSNDHDDWGLSMAPDTSPSLAQS
jgi:hypothetical protein